LAEALYLGLVKRENMDKDKREKDLLYQWGIEHTENYQFQSIDKSKESYFIERKEEEYIKEYGFETVPELYGELAKIWDLDNCMDGVEKIIAVAAMKNCPSEVEKTIQSQNSDLPKEKEKLPMYIYNF